MISRNEIIGSERTEDASLSDDELMMLAAVERRDAYEILVSRYYAMVCATATQYLNDSLLGRDVAQDTFLAVWTNRTNYVPSGRFRNYLITAVFNRCHMMAREQKSNRRRTEFLMREQIVADVPADIPLDTVMKSEQRQRLQQRLQDLPEKERKVLLLRFGQELSIAETAELLDMPVGTAKSHASRGLKRLQRMLRRRRL